MLIARSFDVNKPGCNWKDVKGGVVGGSLIRASSAKMTRIEIRPGRQMQVENRIKWIPITTTVTSINAGSKVVEAATPGGLLGVGTRLDPALTKSDALARPGTGPRGETSPGVGEDPVPGHPYGAGSWCNQRTHYRTA